MKKNISINICGTIYSIDEDAYQLLEHYLDSMKRYFSQEGDEDIADDIEHRVAELLWEQKQNGRDAVNIEMVKEIIEKIGNPADIADESTIHEDTNGTNNTEGEEYNKNEGQESKNDFQERFNEFASDAGKAAGKTYDKVKNHVRNRRFYRDTKDKMLGGVCSGLAEYIGGDPVVWRIGVVLLALLFNSATSHWWMPNFLHIFIPVAYIILWIVVPEAKTPEDKIRMKGQEVNPETLKEQIVSDIEEQEPQSPRPVNNNGGCLRLIFGVILAFLLLPLFLGFLAIVFGLVLMTALTFDFAPSLLSIFPETEFLPELMNYSSPFLWLGLVAGLFVIGLPIYAIIRALRSSSKPMSAGSIMSIIVIWILSVALAIFSVIFSGVKIQQYWDKEYEKNHEQIENAIDSLQNIFNEPDTIEYNYE